VAFARESSADWQPRAREQNQAILDELGLAATSSAFPEHSRGPGGGGHGFEAT
jgi:hypothetical protein